MEGYRLFRKDRQGRRGGGVLLYVNDQLECMELRLGMDEEPTERLWVRIKGRAGTGDIIVGICYRPPDQEDRADEALYRQTGAVSRSQALVIMGDFNHPNDFNQPAVGGTTQQGMSNPRGSWNVLMTTSFSK